LLQRGYKRISRLTHPLTHSTKIITTESEREREREEGELGCDAEREKKMVNHMLMITADFDNIASLQPQGGCDDPDFSYFFKVPSLSPINFFNT